MRDGGDDFQRARPRTLDYQRVRGAEGIQGLQVPGIIGTVTRKGQ